MFMYSTKDPSTYTDPQLIEHLIDRMFDRGYRNLACADARSTYGVFFTNREVKTVARHIGLPKRIIESSTFPKTSRTILLLRKIGEPLCEPGVEERRFPHRLRQE